MAGRNVWIPQPGGSGAGRSWRHGEPPSFESSSTRSNVQQSVHSPQVRISSTARALSRRPQAGRQQRRASA